MLRAIRVLAFACLAAVSSFDALAAKESASRLLVIAPESWQPALAGFIAFKATQLPTTLCSLESILRSSAGVDDPEKLKRYLFEEWRSHLLGYVLLVGDVDVMPVRYAVLDRATPATCDYAFFPSDLYYADLAKRDGSFENWNARQEGYHARYFGEVRGDKNKEDAINYDGVEYLPEIAVGRWPVSTPQQARLIGGKTEAYERGVIADFDPYVRRAAFASVGGWVDSRGMMDRLAAKLVNPWQVEKRYFSDRRRASGTLPPNHEQLRSLLNGGVSLAVHTGHGQSDAWEQCLSMADLDHLTNAANLPVLISAGCSTAYFTTLPPEEPYVDVEGKEHAGTLAGELFTAPPVPPSPYQQGRCNPTGLGEQLLKRSANGAVAYIGCSADSQPSGLTLVEGFVSAVSKRKSPRLGDCWSDAIRYYYDRENLASLKPNPASYPSSVFLQGMKFMVFGDPSMRLPESR